MEIRQAHRDDLEHILGIYQSARQFMIANNNPNQWKNNYPDKTVILEDINNKHLFVCHDETSLLGCFAFIEGEDPTYQLIINGNWLNDLPYAVIHRMAIRVHGKGIGTRCVEWCNQQHNNIRADTHKNNNAMQKLLTKSGFAICGVIYNRWGDERLAFQHV